MRLRWAAQRPLWAALRTRIAASCLGSGYNRLCEQARSHIESELSVDYCEVFAICLSDVRQIKRVVS